MAHLNIELAQKARRPYHMCEAQRQTLPLTLALEVERTEPDRTDVFRAGGVQYSIYWTCPHCLTTFPLPVMRSDFRLSLDVAQT